MKMKKFLVSAGTVIDFFNGRSELFHLFDDVEELAISSVSCGEIYTYARLSEKIEDAFSISRDFCSQLEQLPVTSELCEKFSELKQKILKKNIVVPDNKIWVAATAVFYELVLVTDDPDFNNFKELKTKSYANLA